VNYYTDELSHSNTSALASTRDECCQGCAARRHGLAAVSEAAQARSCQPVPPLDLDSRTREHFDAVGWSIDAFPMIQPTCPSGEDKFLRLLLKRTLLAN
jgi:hypothetical protein